MTTMLRFAGLLLAGFVAMEAVSYATHRWVMHGIGMIWHRSHHRSARRGRGESAWELNDLFPVVFSLIGITLFAVSTMGPRVGWLLPVAIGVTVYGMTYLFVHDVFIHRRLPVTVPADPRLRRLADAHELHHRFGGEPYGMLFPVVPRSLRERAARTASVPVDEGASDERPPEAEREDAASMRAMRSRL